MEVDAAISQSPEPGTGAADITHSTLSAAIHTAWLGALLRIGIAIHTATTSILWALRLRSIHGKSESSWIRQGP